MFEAAATWDEAATHLEQLIEYRWSARLIRILHEAHPELARFSAALAGRRVGEFRSEDCRHLLYNRARVLEAHAARRPSRHGAGEMGVLSREFNKKTRHLPVRRLLTEAGLAVRRIKPVFLMSPFSVATYLPRRTDLFDLVVFDEASQVRPVDALGALARGRQAVVVGDTRQLPPTLFFDRLDEGGDDDESPTQDIESILHQMKARGAAESMLRWHYRSRHHSLIAYSNRGFYGDRLVLFPSPELTCEARGLRLVHLPDGVYEPGASRRRNPVEARQVAEAVLRHARETPRLSLGVAAFNLSQMQLLLDEVEILRRQNPDTDAFFAAHPDEPFFVKNLENIQGDERDVIFISVGYGRDASGWMSMNFGPLSNDGGERRLNVLISRARESCQVFSSITADDIDVSRARSRGARAFKVFLKYAETGILGTAQLTDRDYDSEFERQVAEQLAAHGVATHPQVGVAGFFLDLAVVDPDAPGRYLLGIECDGANYHRSRSARDRDRLRQAVLEDRGWLIHRIWSTDWFHRPDEQLRKVLEAVEQAKILQARRRDRPREHPPRTNRSRAPQSRPSVSRESSDGEESGADGDSLSQPYVIAAFRVPAHRAIHDTRDAELARVVARIVDIEGPIHEQEIARRVAQLWGLSRTGKRIREAVMSALRVAEGNAAVSRDGTFYLPRAEASIPVRNRGEVEQNTLRQPQLLPPMEVREALAAVVRTHLGIRGDEAVTLVARLLGFPTTTARLARIIQRERDRLLESGLLVQRGDKLSPAEDGVTD